MAQFDVYRNAGRNNEAIPYVVIVQSSIFEEYRRRVVVPLVRKSHLGPVSLERFNPTFEIENTPVVLHPLEIVSVETSRLGSFVVSLAGSGQDIMHAMDELFARAYG